MSLSMLRTKCILFWVRQLATLDVSLTSRAITFGIGRTHRNADEMQRWYHCMQTTLCTVFRDDDEMRTGLRGHITALMPQEIILPRKGLTATTSKVLRASLRNPRRHQLTPGDRFWDADRTLQEIKEAAYFNPTAKAEQNCLPQALQVSVPSWW